MNYRQTTYQKIKYNLLEKLIRYLFEKNYGLEREFLWKPLKIDAGGWNPDVYIEGGSQLKIDPSLVFDDFYLGDSTPPPKESKTEEQEEILNASFKLVKRQKDDDLVTVTAKSLHKNSYGTYGNEHEDHNPFKMGKSRTIHTGVGVPDVYRAAPTVKEQAGKDGLGGRGVKLNERS